MSADADQPLDDLSRDELEDRVRELEGAAAAMAIFVNELRDDDHDRIAYDDPDFIPVAAETFRELGSELAELRETKREYEAFMDEYGVGKPRDQDEAWTQIVRAARNKQGNPQHSIRGTNEVALFVGNIETATGYSDRHCSNLIEEYGDEKDGTRWIEHEPASAGNNHSATRKQLVVDLDVWGENS